LPKPPLPPDALTSRPRRGTVALIERTAITVADLTLSPDDVRVHKFTVSHNGRKELVYFDHDPESMVAALVRVLQEQSLPPKLAAVGLPDAAFGTSLVPLPRTTPAATAALVARHVRDEAVAPEADQLADHAVIDSVDRSPDAPRRAYVSWCSRPLLDTFTTAFRRHRMDIGRVVPPSVALLDLFGRTRPATSHRFELLLRYAYPSLVIGVHYGREPVYLRVLRDVMADATDGVTGTVAREVLNTIAYTIENHQGRTVERVCVSGLPPAEVARLQAKLQQDAGIPAESFAVPLAEGATSETPIEALAVMTALLAHGTPLPGASVRAMDLLPSPVKRFSRAFAVMAGISVLSVAVSLISLFLAQATVDASRGAVAMLEDDQEQVVQGAVARNAALLRAAGLQPHRTTLAMLDDRHGNPVQPLLEAMLLAPPEAELTSISLDNPPAAGDERPRLDLRLSGDFSGEGGAARQRAFTDALASRPWCASLSLVHGGLRTTDDGAPVESLGVGIWLR